MPASISSRWNSAVVAPLLAEHLDGFSPLGEFRPHVSENMASFTFVSISIISVVFPKISTCVFRFLSISNENKPHSFKHGNFVTVCVCVYPLGVCVHTAHFL